MKIYKLISSAKQGFFALALTVFSGTAHAQTTYTFNYTGAAQTMNLPGGSYLIECWGADGGDGGGTAAPLTGIAGKGGYSKGVYTASGATMIYIYAGEKGQSNGNTGAAIVTAPGGWNGGGGGFSGSSSSNYKGGGGGATHVATAAGVLSSLSGNQAAVIIVAGGGGGGGGASSVGYTGSGGNGGGTLGQDGVLGISQTTHNGKGGTQSTGGAGGVQGTSIGANGSFGLGGDGGSVSGNSFPAGGGGGGWYGGGGGATQGGSGGGGSSYIGGVTSAVTTMSGQPGFPINPDLIGNGYVLITELCNIGLAPSKNPICVGEAITLTTSAVSNVVWGHTPSTATLVNISPTSNTTYSLTGKAATGCTTSAVIIVTVNPVPVLSAAVMPSVVCVNGSATLIASGALSYTWASTGNTGATTTVSPSGSTNYNYSGSNQFGCITNTVVTVGVNTNSLGITSNTSVCLGSSVQLQLSNAVTYTWSTGNNFATTVVSPVTNTTYMGSGTDINNCLLTNMVAVTVNQKPNVTASTSKQFVCKGEAVSLNAGGANTYTWSNNAAGASVNVTLPAETVYNYVVTGTDANGCTNTANVQVTANRCTGINEASKAIASSRIYPNPSMDKVTIETSGEQIQGVIVTDLAGRVVMSLKAENTSALNIDISSLSQGVYYFTVSSPGGSGVHKVIKN